MILGFAHPAVVVSDLERSRDFYSAAFGFRVLSDEGWSDTPEVDAAIGSGDSRCRGYMLAGHNCFLEIFEFENPQQTGPEPSTLGPHERGLRHLSFFVDDVEAEYERVLALGAQALGAPQKASGITAVYLRDPDGNIIELCECPTPEEDLRRLPGIKALQEWANV
ncbi:VOC family protein [Congregibacter brevis]|uniref:VOC family protein n=1 Tax=Congregibacter brevis TaxID=3081201 RepID=A0ABZ0IFA7_9GAMM|nr:VOC family protein [Congregibacter sp. IMCC45268]